MRRLSVMLVAVAAMFLLITPGYCSQWVAAWVQAASLFVGVVVVSFGAALVADSLEKD